MNNWEKKVIKLLVKSLKPLPTELNEVDWKSDISSKPDRLAQHMSAFSNQFGGGFIIFGINNEGVPSNFDKERSDLIMAQLGNIARNNLEPAVILEHQMVEYEGTTLLAVYIIESVIKPVYIRKKDIYFSFVRSAGQTRKMTKVEVKKFISSSSNLHFEEQIALNEINSDEVLLNLDYPSYFQLTQTKLPDTKKGMISRLIEERFISEISDDKYSILNLGAILFAKDLSKFSSIQRKAIRVIIYNGTNRLKTKKEQPGIKGYASGFSGLVRYVNDQLPTNEIIEQAFRKEVKMYPEIAVRELIANALIHQDFDIEGAGVIIEIFDNRIEITNPGQPLIDIYRFIDAPPRSRNEILASFMRRINICEERGSGIDKVISSIELFQLPAPEFITGEGFTRVILHSYRPLTKMDKNDKIRACYQHCCLKYVEREKMTNSSIRSRFNIEEKNYPMASRIISDALEAGFVKEADPNSSSKKFASYVPFWAD